MRTWIPLVLLTMALTATSGLAADPPNRDSDTATQLRAIARDIEALRHDMDALRRDVNDMGVRGADTASRLLDLQQRVDALQALVYRADSAARRAYSYTPPTMPPASETTPLPAAPPTGTIMLRNFSALLGTFVINGQAYSVAPGQSVEVRNVPLGSFTYEIAVEGYGVIRPATTRMLTAGSPYYLNINP